MPLNSADGQNAALSIGFRSGPSNRDLMLLESERECFSVTVSLLECEPAGMYRMSIFVNEEYQRAVIIDPDAPMAMACIGGFRAGLNDVTVQLTRLSKAENEHTHSCRFHVKVNSCWQQGKKNRRCKWNKRRLKLQQPSRAASCRSCKIACMRFRLEPQIWK